MDLFRSFVVQWSAKIAGRWPQLKPLWLWVRIQLQSLKTSDFVPASSKEFLDIQATIECGFTLKRLRDMTRTYM